MGRQDQNLESGGGRYRAVLRVLVLMRYGSDLLMLKGAPDKRLWADLYNGVGGHVESGEDVLSAARRELLEESGLEPKELRLVAVANIDAGENDIGVLMFVFVGWSRTRQIRGSREGELYWLPVETIHRYELVEDLHWLLPKVLDLPGDNEPLFLHYRYDQDDRLHIRTAQV